MWLVILSDQLKIKGLVSHYLTNYLILHRRILQQKRKIFEKFYVYFAFIKNIKNRISILIRLYIYSVLSWIVRQLPMYYSPVCYKIQIVRILFNLHVLGLLLAFILSQDQTLINFSFILFTICIFTYKTRWLFAPLLCNAKDQP
jgi:hypothetical protein